MRSIRRVFLILIAILVAGCGGHSGSSLAPTGRTLQPRLNGGNPGLSSPTLYVSGQGSVYAYDLGASGNTPPVTKTTGYYYQAGAVNASIAGIATNTAGDLIIVQNFSSPQGSGNSCGLVYIPARNGPSASSTTTAPCSNSVGGHTTGAALGVTFTGPPTGALPGSGAFTDDIDVLMQYVPSGNPAITGCGGPPVTSAQFEVDRYQASSGSITPQSCVTLDLASTAAYRFIGGGTNGTFFVDYTTGTGGRIERYGAGGGTPTSTGSIPGKAGPLAVAVNYATGVGYRVLASTTGGVTTIYSFKVSGSGMTLTHALGTFNNTVGALAVDNNGTIYVGVNQPNGVTKVKVYGPSKTEATDPDYILNNAVRRPNPAASPAAVITGIAISQQNAAPPPTPAPVIVVTNYGTSNTGTVYDQDGNQQAAPGGFPNLSAPDGSAYDPANGLIYVTNYVGNSVTVYDKNGNQQTAPGGFPNVNNPIGIAYDSANGFLYVTNNGNNGVTVYDQYGTQRNVSGTFPNLDSPYHIAYDPANGFLYVANYGNNTVTVYDQNGNQQTVAGSFANLNGPVGIAFDSINRFLYVTNNSAPVSVTVYDQNGIQQSVSGTFTQLDAPYGIAFDAANGFLYVANSNNTVTVYDNSGNQQSVTGIFQDLDDPRAVTVVP